MATNLKDFNKALQIGRPPNVIKLFPNSRALLVSGKVIDRAMIAKGKAMTIAANGRNHFVIHGTLQAAQRANAAVIIEIAKSEGGASSYCAVTSWSIARETAAQGRVRGRALAYHARVEERAVKGRPGADAGVR